MNQKSLFESYLKKTNAKKLDIKVREKMFFKNYEFKTIEAFQQVIKY